MNTRTKILLTMIFLGGGLFALGIFLGLDMNVRMITEPAYAIMIIPGGVSALLGSTLLLDSPVPVPEGEKVS
jgi:hypothetical protein